MPFMTANTPVMVSKVVSNRPQVRRSLRYVVVTIGFFCAFSTCQKITNRTAATTISMAMSHQLAPASFSISLMARYAARNAAERSIAPSQSIFGVSSAVDSRANDQTSTTASTATPHITQNTERKPKLPASQPPSNASTPAMPPLTEVRIAMSLAYRALSVTSACSMSKVIGTTGPATPESRGRSSTSSHWSRKQR